MARTRVGVLRGGKGAHYDASLSMGGDILRFLPALYERRDIFVDKGGIWHMDGIPTNIQSVHSAVDVILNTIHDTDDISSLHPHNVPHTGSCTLGSAISKNKHLAKAEARKVGLRAPNGIVVSYVRDGLRLVHEKVSPPWYVKPSKAWGDGIPVRRAHELEGTFLEISGKDDSFIVEELLTGRDISCAVVEGFRGDDLYVLPPTEHLGGEMYCPSKLPRSVAKGVEEATRKMHRALGLRHYSQSYFIVNKMGVHYLETEALPSLSEKSTLSKSFESVGCSYPQLLDHLVGLALKNDR